MKWNAAGIAMISEPMSISLAVESDVSSEVRRLPSISVPLFMDSTGRASVASRAAADRMEAVSVHTVERIFSSKQVVFWGSSRLIRIAPSVAAIQAAAVRAEKGPCR